MSKQVFARWENVQTLPDDIGEIHISCGVGDAQWDGFFITDRGACMTITYKPDGYEITFTAPSCEIETHEGYWLSPCPLGEDEAEAVEFGTRGATS